MAACKHWIEYAKDWRLAPMAYWVHIEQDSRGWRFSRQFLPEAPSFIPHKGFPIICAEYQGFILHFSSTPQLEEFVRVIRMKPLPTVRRLVALRGGGGLNGHWLSRLPARLKKPRVREKLARALEQVLLEIVNDRA